MWTADHLNVLSPSIPRAEDVQGWSHLSDIELPEIQNKDVLETIPKFERARSVLDLDLSNQNLPHERTLGVQWNMDSDTFTFK